MSVTMIDLPEATDAELDQLMAELDARDSRANVQAPAVGMFPMNWICKLWRKAC